MNKSDFVDNIIETPTAKLICNFCDEKFWVNLPQIKESSEIKCSNCHKVLERPYKLA